MDDRCSVLITSCDKYEDTWEPFFKLFQTMWPECPYRVYLNTETKSIGQDVLEKWGGVQVLHPFNLYDRKNKPISWSRRLKEVLSQITEKYVIMLIDDFFLKSPVRYDVIKKCLLYMEQNTEACAFKFFPDPSLSAPIVCEEFGPADPNFMFCVSCMATLWRKDYLYSILRDEDPWDFEFFASARYRNQKNRKQYIYTQKTFTPVFDYMFQTENGSWSAILRGKWLISVPAFFNQYNLNIDFNKRGIIDPNFEQQSIHKKGGLKRDLIDCISNPSRIVHYFTAGKNILVFQYKKYKARFFNH